MSIKEIKSQLFEELTESKWKIIISTFLIVIVFNDWLELIVNSFLIPNVYHFLKSTWYTDLVILLILIFLIPFKNFKKQIASTSNILSFTCFLILITYYRYFSLRWDFYSFSFSSKIKYVDVMWILYAFQLISWFRKFKAKEKNVIEKPAFLEDLPISNSQDDKYHFDGYALKIAEKLNIGIYKKSFALGINGSWGSGKTSLLNLVTANLENDKTIIIKFNPWSCQNNDILIREFFNQVSSAIKPHNNSVGKLFMLYSKKLISASEIKLSTVFSDIIEEFTDDNSIKALYNDIDIQIRKLNKKIIITIDDIDRLNFEEINEVLKLVRNTANFSNTIFLLSYDKNYINKAVEKLNSNASSLYIEKIVQLEINLPSHEKRIIKDQIIKELKESFPELNLKFLEELHQGHNWGGDYISPFIQNLRDVNRLINGIKLNYSGLVGEVIFADFFKVEILRLKLPNIYEIIRTGSSIYLKTTENSYQRNGFKLARISDQRDSEPLILSKIKELYPEYDSKTIVNFLNTIFIDKYDTISHERLSVVYPSNFIRYFRYLVSSNEISELEFSNARNAGLVEMKKKIDEWVGKDRFEELRQIFIDINSYDDEQDYKVIIHSILYYANKEHNHRYSSHVIGYDYYDFKKKLNLNSSTTSKNEKDLLYKIVENVSNVKSFELSFLNQILSESSHEVKIPRDEILELYIKKVNEIIERVTDFKKEFWKCYHMKNIKGWDNMGNHMKSKTESLSKIEEKLKSKFLGFPIDDIIPDLVEYNFRSDDNLMKMINKAIVKEFFDNYEQMKEHLDDNKAQSKYYTEFLDFYEKNKKVNFEQYIEYEFKIIPERQ